MIDCRNPKDPNITAIFSSSAWQYIQTSLMADREMVPDGSEEYKFIDAIITAIKNQTGVEPDWSLIP